MISRIVLITIVALAPCRTARAQTTGEGAVVFGTGMYSNGFSSGPVMQFGGGGEAVSDHRLGVGGDVLFSGGGDEGWMESSLKASYHFPRQGISKRLEPFVSGGFTWLGVLGERNGIGGLNVGGGLTYWLGREGVKLEFREVVFNNGYRETQYWTARVGLSFR